MLKLNNISLIYQSKNTETHAVDNLSFEVKKGEFVSIVGPSGCGKTTLLSLIAGLIKPSNGSITLNGEKITKPTPLISYMFQKDNLFEWLTIEKNVNIGLTIMHKANKEAKAYSKNLLAKYGLKDFISHHPHELSGGMRQRVALIRTLATKPEILLLDEPFSALDYQTRLMVQDDVHKIIKSEGKTAILVTHDISEAVSMSDRVFILTARPATLKKELVLNFEDNLSPFQRRSSPIFNQYFNEIWGELA